MLEWNSDKKYYNIIGSNQVHTVFLQDCQWGAFTPSAQGLFLINVTTRNGQKPSSSMPSSEHSPINTQPPVFTWWYTTLPSNVVYTLLLSSNKNERCLWLVMKCASTTGQFFFLTSSSQSSIQPTNSLKITGSLRTWMSSPNLSSSRSNVIKYELSYKKINK